MRRAPRRAALLVLLAVAAAGCAEVTTEQQALLDRAVAQTDREFSARGGDDQPADDDLSGEDFAADDPWVDEATIDDETTTGRVGERPEIDQFRCPFNRDAVTTARCGKIELPGRGVDPDYTIDLAFVRFSATGDEADYRPDPVIYLHGGPGGAILETADYWYESVVAPHIRTRDVILFDQRGAGRSSPLPACFEVGLVSDAFYFEATPHADVRDDYLDALAACADRLHTRTDIDLSAFNSRANALDLLDLVWALGIDDYNLHGSSYGTRLAQTIMREDPTGVRAVVLSGAYPIDVNLMGSVASSLESSLDAVFAGCAASPQCATALPDPWKTLEALVRRLDAEPLRVEAPVTVANTITMTFDGTDFLNGVHGLLYSGFHAATLPDLLIDWSDGDDRRLERLARESVFDHSDVAVFIAVQCADEADFTTTDQLDRPLTHPFLAVTDVVPSVNGVEAIEICDDWHRTTTDPIENDPVSWDVPTLLLSGAIDPITPPAWAETLAARLPRSRLINFPELAHDSDDGWCALGLIGDFVEQPDVLVDSSCAVSPALTVDDNANRFREPLTLIDRSHDFDGDGEYADFQAPPWSTEWFDEWQLLWRAHDQLDPTALVLVGPDVDFDPSAHLGYFGLPPDWTAEPSGRTPAGWERDVQRLSATTAIRYRNLDTGVQLVLLLEPGEPDDLEATVLAPAAVSLGSGA